MQEPSDPGSPETVLVDPERHVESFRQAREARRSELVEDYVELIDDVLDEACGHHPLRWHKDGSQRSLALRADGV